ncbi:MAG: hypothetical protein HQL76_02455 [Magnetococcales bacterium]|nr:hypothetical protein [Magnetococcales bacterium]
MLSDFIIGLDLGQSQDFTAVTILERFFEEKPARYHLRHAERFKLGTSYPDQVAKVGKMLASEQLRNGKATLVVDGTGAGRPVVDMFRDARLPAELIAVTITGGDSVSEEGRDFRVPKRDLVSALQVLLQSGRLKVAGGMPEADTLVQELLNFKVEITMGGHDKYEAWREGIHDDLVLSAAMACWYGEWKPHLTIEFQAADLGWADLTGYDLDHPRYFDLSDDDGSWGISTRRRDFTGYLL